MIEWQKHQHLFWWEQENLWSFDEERKGKFEKTEDGQKIYFLKLQYDSTPKLIRRVWEK